MIVIRFCPELWIRLGLRHARDYLFFLLLYEPVSQNGASQAALSVGFLSVR